MSIHINSTALTITETDLQEVFRLKYGNTQTNGWGPRMRLYFNYFTPDDYYEVMVAKLVTNGSSWLDVGCGRNIFPDNHSLARLLTDRCRLVVGVDPDGTIEENPFVHQRFKSTIEEFYSNEEFDLITLRMVAEHVANPESVVASLFRLTKPGGKVVICTVNKWSLVSVITRLIPFNFHHPIKKILRKTEDKDTFPVMYRMNTRKILAQLFEKQGFQECYFSYLDDCRTFARFRGTLFMELSCRSLLYVGGIKYPENCLLSVYSK
jgi:2-polyprenyl-3-methyl-5-hydroxy-6-metoxy-1,4-benzoquinol methylase